MCKNEYFLLGDMAESSRIVKLLSEKESSNDYNIHIKLTILKGKCDIT